MLAAAAELGAEDPDRFTHGTTIATNALLERQRRAHGVRDDGGVRAPAPPSSSDARAPLPSLRGAAASRSPRSCAAHGVRGTHGAARRARAARPESLPAIHPDAEAIAVCLLFSFLDPTHEQRGRGGAAPALPARARRRVARGRAGVPRVRARVDDGHRRLSRPGPRPLPACPLRAVRAWRPAGAARDALLGRPRDARGGGRPRGVRAPLRPCRRRRRRSARSRGSPASRTRSPSTWAARRPTSARSSAGRRARDASAMVGGFPVRLPTLDVHTVGAGGGSIVWEDAGGALRVGPESAGADPGPACYGQGGTQPTVTDANLVLGRLPSQPRGRRGARPRAAAERRSAASTPKP